MRLVQIPTLRVRLLDRRVADEAVPERLLLVLDLQALEHLIPAQADIELVDLDSGLAAKLVFGVGGPGPVRAYQEQLSIVDSKRITGPRHPGHGIGACLQLLQQRL